jgi:integrase
MLMFAILCGVRTNPVRRATWSEIDLDTGVWHIPDNHEKSGKEHLVPLSKWALALLRDLRPIDCEPDDVVFAGEKGRKHLRGHATMWNLLRRLGIQKGVATVHGFRSTIRDWAGEETSYPSDVAEAMLSHKLGDGTRISYQRGCLFSQRMNLMEDWAQFLAGSEVIGMKRAA